RRGCRPLEGIGLPRIVARRLPMAQSDAVEEVEEEDEDRDANDVRADRREEVQTGPFRRLRIVERASRHPIEPELVHREEGQVHADEEEEEMDPAELLAEQPAA